MLTLVIILHCIIAFLIILFVIIQHCKTSGMTSSLTSGFSHTVFGSKSSAPFMFKCTIFLILLFFLTTLCLHYCIKNDSLSNKNIQHIDNTYLSN